MCDTDETSLQSILDASALRGPENSVGFWVWRMSLAYQHRVEATLKDLDLTHLQFLILVLSGWLGLTAAPVHQVSLMIKALKAKNLIAQTVSKADPRARVITLTGPGVKLLGRAAPLMTDLQSQIWPAGQDTTQMVNLLKSTLKRLQETE
jgi:DNA-binding MarR family transcriptional regulator